MEFKKRTEAPKKDNKFYLHTPKGYNKCIRIVGDECIPNCTGYAYGRWMEAQKLTKCDLPTSNAENWYHDYKGRKGKTVEVGSIICWKQGKLHADKAGHVAYVEHVYLDRSFDTSESAYNGKRWYTRHYDSSCYRAGYEFEGFLYPLEPFEIPDEFPKGIYKVLYNKYLRTSPEVKSNNKIVWKSLLPEWRAVTYADSLGKARFKINTLRDLIEFTTDNKGNIWGRCKTKYTPVWLCVYDSSGKQVEKV